MKVHQYWVYMMTNKGDTVLYTGVTNDIQQRVFDHRTGRSKVAFTWRYQCWKLVHMEEYNDINIAIAREKQLKSWKRAWKNELIARDNPEWKDLSAEWDYSGWFNLSDPPIGYYQQGLKEHWGGPLRDSGSSPE
ncbi:MAG: GIY-YIG nuclease family protein [Flavobacteriales bacterium]